MLAVDMPWRIRQEETVGGQVENARRAALLNAPLKRPVLEQWFCVEHRCYSLPLYPRASQVLEGRLFNRGRTSIGGAQVEVRVSDHQRRRMVYGRDALLEAQYISPNPYVTYSILVDQVATVVRGQYL